MKTNETLSLLFAGLLMFGTATAAVAQTGTQDHDAHHPAGPQAAPAAPTGDAPPPAGMQGGMPGMDMMTPEMMQTMQRMRRMQAGDAMQRGMMMDPSMMMCPTTPGGMGMGPGAGMRGMMGGAGVL